MIINIVLVVSIFIIPIVAGCANVNTVRYALQKTSNTGEGVAIRYFKANSDQLRSTVLTVMQDYGMTIQSIEDISPNEIMIVADKGINAFSWGEVVGVIIKTTEEDKSIVKIISKRKLSTNITARDWTTDILSGISARIMMLNDMSHHQTYDTLQQNEDWLRSINKAVSTIFSFESKPTIAIGCDSRFGDYISGRISSFIGINNPNVSIIASGKDLTHIISQQELSLSGLYNEETAVQVGKLVDAKYLLICTPYFKAASDNVELHIKIVNIENGKFLSGGLIVYIHKNELPQL